MSDFKRRKVGDKDPNFDAEQKRAKAKADRSARIKSREAATMSAAAPKKQRSDFAEYLRDAVTEYFGDKELRKGPKGQTIDEVVTEAVGQANEAPREY